MQVNDEIAWVFEKLEQWHSIRTNQLKTILEHKDAPIKLDGVHIEPDTDLAKGLRIGVMLSLELLGKLPFSLEKDHDN